MKNGIVARQRAKRETGTKFLENGIERAPFHNLGAESPAVAWETDANDFAKMAALKGFYIEEDVGIGGMEMKTSEASGINEDW
jgi:hypothetical protein